MAICIAIATDGTVVPTGEAVEACSGYVLLSGSEHAAHTVIDRLLDWPEGSVAATWLVGSFGFVLGSYLIAKLVGSVVSMFR